MRELYTNGKNHEWEFEEGFSKEIYALAKEVIDERNILTLYVD